MEFYYFPYFAFLLFCLMLAKTAIKSGPVSKSKLQLPPGPMQLPIIGNLHQLFGGQTHHVLRDLAKKYGPLMHLKIGEVSTIVVSSPEIAKEIFSTHDILFADRPSNVLAFKIVTYGFADMVLCPYGNFWRQLRKICTMELLSPKSVQSFRSIREEEVLNLIRSICLEKGSTINLGKKISSLICRLTARAAFGKRYINQEEFIRLQKELSKSVAEFCIADLFPSVKFLQVISALRYKIEKIHKQFDRVVQNILDEHKDNIKKSTNGNGEQKEDLVDVLLNIQRSGDFETPLTDKNIKAVIFNIFIAGTDTSSTAIEWAMSEMIKNPTTMKKAQNEVRDAYDRAGNVDESKLHELKYLHAVIKETLRLHPSVPLLLPRKCRQECEIKGYRIPDKARVMVNAWAIGRDPEYWTEPEKFNPDRFLESEIDFKGNSFEYIPFGGGRRICPGISFALASIGLPLAQLLFHFDWKLSGESDPEQLDMTESAGLTVRRKDDLHLIPVPYSSSSLKDDH